MVFFLNIEYRLLHLGKFLQIFFNKLVKSFEFAGLLIYLKNSPDTLLSTYFMKEQTNGKF